MRKLSMAELGRPDARSYSRARKIDVVVILDNIRSNNNVGSIFRTCDAFAVSTLYLCGITGTPPDRDIHKTALGAEQTVRWEYFKDPAECVRNLIQEGYTAIAVEQAEGSDNASVLSPVCGKKYALILGNEVDGVSQEVMDLCHRAIEIPQSGTKHSLNVAVAAGIVIWEFYKTLL